MRSRRRLARPLCLAILFAAACTGAVGTSDGPDDPASGGAGGRSNHAGSAGRATAGSAGGDPTMPTSSQPTFACDDAAVPPSVPLRKLTNVQYRNTLRDLLTFALGSTTDAMAALSEVAGALDALPADQRQIQPLDPHGSYRRLDQNIQQIQVTGSHAVAVKLGAALTTSARLPKLVGACATNASDDACVTSFIKKLGARAFRRPLDDAEVALYKMFYADPTGGQAARYADVVTGLLDAPQFLFHVEHGGNAVAGQRDVFELTPYELASRLSYQYWNTMPDQQLWDDAAAGKLSTTDGIKAAVSRLWQDARAQPVIDEFFQDYFKLEDLPPLDRFNTNATFKAFAGSNVPTPSLRTAVFDDALQLARHFVWTKPGHLQDLFSTELSFAKSDELASIYGVPAWKSGDPPSFPSGVRPGFLTRAFALMTASTTTRPIMKGVYIRRNVLCDEIPPPPANAANTMPTVDGTMSTRAAAEAITGGGICAGCHKTMINPLGAATENFDGLARLRTTETVYDLGNASPTTVKVLGMPKIDTRSKPHVNFDDETESAGAADLEKLIVDSGKAQACFARHYFRFTFQRWEDTGVDGCALERLRNGLGGDRSLPEALRDVALDPSFRVRQIKTQ